METSHYTLIIFLTIFSFFLLNFSRVPIHFTSNLFVSSAAHSAPGILGLPNSRISSENKYTFSILPCSPSDDSPVERFFNQKRAQRFRLPDLLNVCAHPEVSSYGALIQGAPAGFGSNINNALNVYLIASEPSVNRTFSIIFSNWMHKWSVFFNDLSPNSSCPFVSEVDQFSLDEEQKKEAKFIFDGNKTLHLEAPEKAFFYSFGAENQYKFFNDTIVRLNARDGWLKLFRRKSLLAQALWDLKEPFRKLLHSFCSFLNCGNYLAVHIRRGDKIKMYGEARKLTDKEYCDKIREICWIRTCPTTVLLISDDDHAVRHVKALMQAEGWHVWTFRDVVRAAGLPTGFLLKIHGGYDQKKYRRLNENDRFKHTRELVLSLTLLSMAKMTLCTTSSNLCRLVMLLQDFKQRVLEYFLTNTGDEVASSQLPNKKFPRFSQRRATIGHFRLTASTHYEFTYVDFKRLRKRGFQS